jgi:hypothetical protein
MPACGMNFESAQFSHVEEKIVLLTASGLITDPKTFHIQSLPAIFASPPIRAVAGKLYARPPLLKDKQFYRSLFGTR